MKEPECLGVKVLTIFPDNFGTGVPSHQGLMLLFDPISGAPLGVIDAHALTNIRTAAASAVATKMLAQPDARKVLILGYGNLAKAHLTALAHVRPLAEVFVWGRSFDRATRFASEERQKHAFRITPIRSVDEVAPQVDIICTVTAAAEPILHGRSLRAGVHVNLVGSSTPAGREIDSAGIATGKFYVDSRSAALALAGELIAAIREGAVTEAHIVGEIGDVALGRCEGRESERDITIFKSLGMIAQDLICARYLLGTVAD
jgi:ornithine cyclodeaminase